MFNMIVNPLDGKKVSIFSQLGKKIIKDYVYLLKKTKGGFGTAIPITVATAAATATIASMSSDNDSESSEEKPIRNHWLNSWFSSARDEDEGEGEDDDDDD